MVINFAVVTGMLVVNLMGGPAASESWLGREIQAATVAAAVIDPFNPPPKVKKRRRPRPPQPTGAPPETQFTDEMDEEPPPPPRRASPPPTRHRPSAAEEPEPEQAAAAQADDEEDERSKPKRKSRKRVVEQEEEAEEEEEDEGGSIASMPVIQPRVISFRGGASTMGRSFQYNSPLQKETTFPRPGVTLALESFPLLHMSNDWWRTIGVGFSLAMEFGAAALQQPGSGASISFPVSQRRWSADVRYAFPAGSHFVVVPALGYGSNVFDLKSLMPVAPSACNNNQTMPCLADINASHLVADLHIRIAATSGFGLSLTGGYYVGLGVAKGAGQIGSERPATAFSGFHVELGATLMLIDWLALQAAAPYNRYSYSFSSGGAGTYSAATETYYGLTGGALIFLP
jgi:hypothetical protein